MTAVTPIWEIPYAQSTDRLCDGDEITQAMAERVDDLLTDFEVSLDALTIVPLARVSRSSAILVKSVFGNQVPLVYDQVDFDTAGLANLSYNPSGLLKPIADGLMVTGGYADWWGSTAVAGNIYNLSFTYDAGNLLEGEAQQASPIAPNAMEMAIASLDEAFATDTSITMTPTQSSGTVSDITVNSARFWTMRVGLL